MIEFIYDSARLREVFSESMDKYQYYDWVVAWMGTPKILYDKLLNNKSKIRTIATGLYDTNGKGCTTTKFGKFLEIHHYPDNLRLFFIKKRGRNSYTDRRGRVFHKDLILHSKLYYFENNDNDWRLFVGSANFSEEAFGDGNNFESMLVVDQDSYDNKEIKEFIAAIRLDSGIKNKNFIHYNDTQLKRYFPQKYFSKDETDQ